jgi:DNA replication licensing factor MCM7
MPGSNICSPDITLLCSVLFCQVALIIELDDVYEFDSGLAEAIVNNTRRYVSIASEVVYEMLPDYKQREVRWSQYLDMPSP